MAEILAPAGDEQTAYAVLKNGANAIYLGLKEFSARSSAENFDLEALSRVARFAHILNARVYVCLNTLVKDSETARFFDLARESYNAGADAILVQDLFLGKKLKEIYPEIELHLSTQAGTCNVYGAYLAKECGFSRVVLARETPLEDIRKITKIIETEVFVQGALCTCFSGQCYLSSFAGNNSGNRGRCKQPCRKQYKIDRSGYEDFAYALSLSDLCVGERVREFLKAGVSSLKIEGRLRKTEYAVAAVRYYRALLAGEGGEAELHRLKRAFNRGDYTAGLAFGQKNLLSRAVQGHLGERVGEIELCGGYFVRGRAQKGDGFKILRGGKEVGGAAYLKAGSGGFFLTSSERLRSGDEVRITSDAASDPEGGERKQITLSLSFFGGEVPVIKCGEFSYYGGEILERARSAPLTAEELKTCFYKTDGLPFAVTFEEVKTENVFLPKSALNRLRRDFYDSLAAWYDERILLDRRECGAEFETGTETRTAVLREGFEKNEADICVMKPENVRQIGKIGAIRGEKFLYLPAFFSSEDEAAIEKILPFFDGIYADGYYGLPFAKKHGKKFFAGTGWNLTNRYALSEARAAGADYMALSKELSFFEQQALSQTGVFVLSCGAVKVMDLCYCPFEKSCKNCDRRPRYTLTDEEGRRFPLRRYELSSCRFEVYNCLPLKGDSGRAGRLVDHTVKYPEELGTTGGHFTRSML